MVFGVWTAKKQLDRRIALLETALWWCRAKWPDDKATQEHILDLIADLKVAA